MANKSSYNKAPNNKTANYKNKGKKVYQQKKKTMGFDLTDPESRIAFWVFIVMAVILSALLIAGFALGFSRCGTPEIPEEDESAPPAVSEKEYADIDDIIALFENPALTESEYNYSNEVFRLSYDPETLAVTDRFGENGSVTVSGENEKTVGLTVTYIPGAEGTDPSAYLDKYVEKMCEKYADYSITPEQGTNAEYEGAKTSQRAFTIYLSEYPVRVAAKMSVRGDKAYVAQMTLGGEQTGDEIRALIDTYYSVGFSDTEQ